MILEVGTEKGTIYYSADWSVDGPALSDRVACGSAPREGEALVVKPSGTHIVVPVADVPIGSAAAVMWASSDSLPKAGPSHVVDGPLVPGFNGHVGWAGYDSSRDGDVAIISEAFWWKTKTDPSLVVSRAVWYTGVAVPVDNMLPEPVAQAVAVREAFARYKKSTWPLPMIGDNAREMTYEEIVELGGGIEPVDVSYWPAGRNVLVAWTLRAAGVYDPRRGIGWAMPLTQDAVEMDIRQVCASLIGRHRIWVSGAAQECARVVLASEHACTIAVGQWTITFSRSGSCRIENAPIKWVGPVTLSKILWPLWTRGQLPDWLEEVI